MSSPRTGLSPEWDRRPDEVFAEIVSHDEDLVRAEFEGLTGGAWDSTSAWGSAAFGAVPQQWEWRPR